MGDEYRAASRRADKSVSEARMTPAASIVAAGSPIPQETGGFSFQFSVFSFQVSGFRFQQARAGRWRGWSVRMVADGRSGASVVAANSPLA
jgi:hypothetical protein